MTKKGLEKRQLIIEKSFHVFRKKGFVLVTMQDIIDECGISRGGLYKYFANTSDIFIELLKSGSSKKTIIEKEMEEKKGFVAIMEDFFKEQKWELLNLEETIRFATYEFFMTVKNEDTAQMIEENYENNVKLIKKLLKYGESRREIGKKENLNTIANQIVIWLEGLNLLAMVKKLDSKFMEEQFEYLLRILLM